MKKVLAVSSGLLLLLSCRKSGTLTDAIILDAGNTNADGCGWIVRIDNDFYHPEELDTLYRIDGMHVKISYHVTSNDFICGIGGLLYDEIAITEIEPQ